MTLPAHTNPTSGRMRRHLVPSARKRDTPAIPGGRPSYSQSRIGREGTCTVEQGTVWCICAHGKATGVRLGEVRSMLFNAHFRLADDSPIAYHIQCVANGCRIQHKCRKGSQRQLSCTRGAAAVRLQRRQLGNHHRLLSVRRFNQPQPVGRPGKWTVQQRLRHNGGLTTAASEIAR